MRHFVAKSALDFGSDSYSFHKNCNKNVCSSPRLIVALDKLKNSIVLLTLLYLSWSPSCGHESDNSGNRRTAQVENLSLSYPSSFTGPAIATLPPTSLARSFWPGGQDSSAVATETVFQFLNKEVVVEKIEVQILPKPSLANWQAAVAAKRAFRFANSSRVLRSEDIENQNRGWRRVVFDNPDDRLRTVEYSTAFRDSIYSVSISSTKERLDKADSQITFALIENLK